MTDISAFMNATQTEEKGFARAADVFSTRIEQTLGFIVRLMLVASCFVLVPSPSYSGQMQCDTQCQAEAHYQQGVANYNAGHGGAKGRAIWHYDEAIRLDPNHASAHNARAWTLYTAGHNEDALPSAERAVSLAPGNAWNLGTKGLILAALGQWQAALTAFEQGLTVAEEDWIKSYQKALKKHGYYKGNSNGDYNSATRAALEACLQASCRVIK